MKKATMNDIARKANVSQTTVSRVINNHPNVNSEVRKRVNQAIKELDYLPNKAAQTLKSNSTHLIGVSVPEIPNPYFANLISELENEARLNGYSILLQNSGYNPMTEIENMDIFLSRQVDGIIYVPTSDYSLQKIRSLNIPTVAVTLPIASLDSVYLNHALGGSLAANHLIKQGHTHFGILTQKYATCPKSNGFMHELYIQGMDTENVTVIDIDSYALNRYQIREEVNRYFNTHEKLAFTALFCSNDGAAHDAIHAAREHGIRVPEDLAVTGFDDTFVAKINKITSIHQPLEEMARTSLKIIFDRIAHPQERAPLDIQLTPSIIVRKSSTG